MREKVKKRVGERPKDRNKCDGDKWRGEGGGQKRKVKRLFFVVALSRQSCN